MRLCHPERGSRLSREGSAISEPSPGLRIPPRTSGTQRLGMTSGSYGSPIATFRRLTVREPSSVIAVAFSR